VAENKMTIRALVLGICIGLVSTGCASIHTRLEPMAPEFVVYPGLTSLFASPGRSAPAAASREEQKPSTQGRDTTWVALCILDIPFSLVLDTALLPIDLLTWPMRAPQRTPASANAAERPR
jgi:uncharacterized protein YceK